MVHEFAAARKLTGNDWLALLLRAARIDTVAPGTPEWEARQRAHGEFAAAAGDHILGGAALHPPSTATTVRVRDGEVLLTDGPFVEGAEVANGFYVLAAADRDEAVKIASMIPASTVELRQLAWVCRDCRPSSNGQPGRRLPAGMGSGRRRAGPVVGRPHRRRRRRPGSLRRGAAGVAARRVPDNPGGWLVTVARNRARDRLRRESVRPGKELAAVVDDIRARTEIAATRIRSATTSCG